ncbi:MAG: PAS domain S-box protein [Thermoleophilia bacterium]
MDERAAPTDPLADDAVATPGGDELREAHAQLRRAREVIDALLETSPGLVVVLDRDGRIVRFSRTAVALSGYAPEEAIGQRFDELVVPVEQRPRVRAAVERVWTASDPDADLVENENQWVTRAGALRTIHWWNRTLRDDHGEVLFVVSHGIDVTDQRAFEQELVASEERLRRERDFVSAVVESAPSLIIAFDRDGTIVRFNRACEEFTGYAADTVVGRSFYDLFIVPDEQARVREALGRVWDGEYPSFNENLFLRHDGEARLIEWTNTAIAGADGAVEYLVSHGVDVTAQRRFETDLREKDERLQLALTAARMGSWQWDAATGSLRWSSELEQLHGLAGGQLGGAVDDVLALVHPDDRPRVRAHLTGDGEHAIEYRAIGPGGSFGWRSSVAHRAIGEGGEQLGLYGLAGDITERHAADEALRRRDAILEAVSGAAQQLLDEQEPEATFPDVLEAIGGAAGVTRAAVIELAANDGVLLGEPRALWVAPGRARPELGPETAGGAACLVRWLDRFRGGEVVTARTVDLPPDQRGPLVAAGIRSSAAVPILVEGALWGSIALDDCDLEREWTSAELDAMRVAASILASAIRRARAASALRTSEEQLRQSQKMEAIGRLAGGIAHDFNNLLTVIAGNVGLAQEGQLDPELREQLDEIGTAAERAASLTDQLLSFSRQQLITPVPLDADAVLRDASRMLARVIGEDVELVTSPAAPGCRVLADPGQLHQVMLNLALNARDSMPRGGRLTLESAVAAIGDDRPAGLADLLPGRYVRIGVEDTGCGMEPAVLERIFEPFFTTKDVGKGTGLGLATVHGIVKQAGGEIVVRSTVGAGTRFDVYLPLVRRQGAADEDEPAGHDASGHETILVAEDEPAVRTLVRRVLERSGYTVLETGDPREALTAALRHEGRIDLLVTDVIMPGLSGRELARELTAARPGLRVLFVSGYTDDDVLRVGVTRNEAAFLQKPFTSEQLLARVRDVLDQPG